MAAQHFDTFEFECDNKSLDLDTSHCNKLGDSFTQYTADSSSAEACTSATSSFSFEDASYLIFDQGRRTSFDSSSVSSASRMLETPPGSMRNPVTPVSLVATHSIPPLSLSCKKVRGDTIRPTSMFVKRDSFDGEDEKWMVVDYDSPPCKSEFADQTRPNFMFVSREGSDDEDAKWTSIDKERLSSEMMGDHEQAHGVQMSRSDDFFLSSIADPVLSSAMFSNQGPKLPASDLNDSILAWKNSSPTVYPGTIAPQTMFRPPSSVLPSTPMKGFSTPLTCDDSPMSTTPARFILPSQREVDLRNHFDFDSDVSSFSSPNIQGIEEHAGFNLPKGTVSPKLAAQSQRAIRESKHQLRRKRSATRPKRRCRSPAETATDEVSVVEPNRFPCGITGCDKGKNGRVATFKRKEHKDRHEKSSAHVGLILPEFFCWVGSCPRKFSRRDNLRMHLRNCHGRKTATRTKIYCATLDRTSRFYSPNWQGEVDTNGEPLDLTEFYGLAVLRLRN